MASLQGRFLRINALNSCPACQPLPRNLSSSSSSSYFSRSSPLPSFLHQVMDMLCVNGRLEDGCCVQGQVRIPTEGKDFGSLERSSSSSSSSSHLNVKVVLNGGQNVTFLKPNGTFSFHNVHSGTHLIEVVAIGFFFFPVWIEVDERTDNVKATLNTRYDEVVLSELELKPVKREEYYQIRRHFSIMAVVKTPLGSMVGIMLILIVAMSNLMKKMGPEELKRAQEEMKKERVSSFLNLLLSTLRGKGLFITSMESITIAA